MSTLKEVTHDKASRLEMMKSKYEDLLHENDEMDSDITADGEEGGIVGHSFTLQEQGRLSRES